MVRLTLTQCQMRDMEGLRHLAQWLAQYFPAPEDTLTAIYELLLNAIEHGTLGIGFDEKAALMRQGCWHEEIARRLALPGYAQRAVRVTLTQDAYEGRLTIADEGEGFAWREHVGRFEFGRRPNGRGLWIVFNSAFDRIRFNAQGNEVTCVAQHRALPADHRIEQRTA